MVVKKTEIKKKEKEERPRIIKIEEQTFRVK